MRLCVDTVQAVRRSPRWGMVAVAVHLLVIGLASVAFPGESLEYNRDIRPVLAEHCFACHGADSASREAGLRLDQREIAIDAGAIVAGKPGESELIQRIFSDDADVVMPPAETKKPLTAEQKELLKQWVAAGAEYQLHWSFIAPVKVQPPVVTNEAWTRNDIDRFVLARLEQQQLTPAPEADVRALFRRLHLDITGLPPAPTDVASFVNEYGDGNETVLSEWIDRLMTSPAWGEHRARYWLDAARYGDTHGLHFDNYREIWPYRDWVIRAFNANLSFDRFSVEQLAGDLLPDPTDDQLIATGFQRCNITTNEGGTIDEENPAVYAADRVQTFGWVYLGLTTNCAQCHDHKFDPFTTKDYYALAAFFRNTTQPAKDGNARDGRSSVLVVPTDEDLPRWSSLPQEIAVAARAIDERKQTARNGYETWLMSATPDSLNAGVLSEHLVTHVPLTDGTGNDVSHSFLHPGTVQATGNITWISEGRHGPAVLIRSGATFELGAQGDFEKDQSFSFGAWVKARDTTTNAGIIARVDEQAAFRGWDLWQNGSSFAVHLIDAWSDNAVKVSTRNPVVNPEQWQHVFATYDGSGKATGVKIYIDGKEQDLRIDANTLKPDASIRTQTPLRIGQRSAGGVFDGGAIQDVRVYDGVLSESDIKTLVDVVALQMVLATAVNDRTPEQNAALYDHYLLTRDQQFRDLMQAVASLESAREAIRRRSPATHIQQEKKDSPATAHVLMRGAYDKPGEKVGAATPAALHTLPKGAPDNRLGLAEWLIDPANPLTARVTVNRFWQQVFGRGIVETPEDFGVMGASPSHPELLDWLAVDFRESGWDVKRFFKQLLMSATYRQAAVTTPEKLAKDGSNVLLSRGPRFRMDAEMVRDYALASSGLLSDTMYGPGVKPYQPAKIWDMVGLPGGDTRNYVQDEGENLYRRAVYTFWKRMAPPPNLEAFNAPSREVCTVRRERTNTPLQALVTLNDPQFVEAARSLAARSLAIDSDDTQVIDEMAHRVLCRPLTQEELIVVRNSGHDLLAYYQSHLDDAQALISVGESKPVETQDVAALAAWTMVCNQLMNLDETLNK
ncbi:MAG: DUF1553 domain-containing protein [Planctomycetaceae bacterium]